MPDIEVMNCSHLLILTYLEKIKLEIWALHHDKQTTVGAKPVGGEAAREVELIEEYIACSSKSEFLPILTCEYSHWLAGIYSMPMKFFWLQS